MINFFNKTVKTTLIHLTFFICKAMCFTVTVPDEFIFVSSISILSIRIITRQNRPHSILRIRTVRHQDSSPLSSITRLGNAGVPMRLQTRRKHSLCFSHQTQSSHKPDTDARGEPLYLPLQSLLPPPAWLSNVLVENGEETGLL